MKKCSLLFLSILFILQACDTLGTSATCNSYILGYYSIPEIFVDTSGFKSSIGAQYHKLQINNGGKILPLSSVFKDYPSDNGKYEEYCHLHGDTTYPTRTLRSIISDAYYNCAYPASDFTSISIVCLEDWDETHPAGSSLGDIATFVAVSVEPYIKKGYVKYDYELMDQPELFNAVYPFRKGYGERAEYPIAKAVDDVTKTDLALLGCGKTFGDYPQICEILVPRRENGSPCTLRIKMTNTDEVEYKVDVAIR